MTFLFDLPETPAVPVKGESARFPVHRIFCVGRNYAAHASEMGVEVDREAPFYFTKAPSALQQSGATIPYPSGTENFHYEMELVVALGRPAFRVSADSAAEAILGYACGLDMTRRDLQLAAREKRRPWDLGKDVERSAVIAEITRAEALGDLAGRRIMLSVNGETKQEASLSDLIHSVPEILSHLSHYYHLRAGDLIYTGTPAGVGPVTEGDRIEGQIDGLAPIALSIGPRE